MSTPNIKENVFSRLYVSREKAFIRFISVRPHVSARLLVKTFLLGPFINTYRENQILVEVRQIYQVLHIYRPKFISHCWQRRIFLNNKQKNNNDKALLQFTLLSCVLVTASTIEFYTKEALTLVETPTVVQRQKLLGEGARTLCDTCIAYLDL